MKKLVVKLVILGLMVLCMLPVVGGLIRRNAKNLTKD